MPESIKTSGAPQPTGTESPEAAAALAEEFIECVSGILGLCVFSVGARGIVRRAEPVAEVRAFLVANSFAYGFAAIPLAAWRIEFAVAAYTQVLAAFGAEGIPVDFIVSRPRAAKETLHRRKV